MYDVFSQEADRGTLNGFAFIADMDTSKGIALGGLEGNLWEARSEADDVYTTDDNIFWIHAYAIPEENRFRLQNLVGSINGVKLRCAGLAYTGLNWNR